MYEYEYVRIDIPFWCFSKKLFDYHDIIRDYVDEGWRLVQIMSPPTGLFGRTKYFELIFERETK